MEIDLETLERLMELMHRQNVHSIHLPAVDIELHPRQRVSTESQESLPHDARLGVPSMEDILYWSAGGPPARTTELKPPTKETVK